MMFHSIEEAIEDLKNGHMVVVVDDEDRENEGDVIMAAEKATSESVNFMVRFARGLVCVPLTAKRVEELELPLMVSEITEKHGTAFTVSVDHCDTDTGISAPERAMTVQALIDSATRPQDLVRPGHIFPLRANEGGVLKRAGHTEAAVDLARLAGLYPAGVICEVMNEDGTMARVPELLEFTRLHGLKLITIADLINYRIKKEKLVWKASEANLPTQYGEFKVIAYNNSIDHYTHLALIKGEIDPNKPTLVRVHSECLTGDVLGSVRCDCGRQLHQALLQISNAENGVLLYMRQEGRGIGLLNKIKAYQLQDQGKDTVEANEMLGFPPDLRDYGIGAQMLVDLEVRKINLLTNNPRKIKGLEGYDLTIENRIPLEVEPDPYNCNYLTTKRNKLGHFLNLVDEEGSPSERSS